MQLPGNSFKQALQDGHAQIGLWLGLADAYASELLASTGFDFLVVDGEHAPNDLRSVLAQLQAIAPYPVHAAVRPVSADAALIKQYLDIGAQTLVVPMVESAEQAARVVASTRYPPHGIRGVGAALARASRWNQVENYVQACETQLCVLVQVESVAGMAQLADIAAVEGVDGVLFGPADLAASMGLPGGLANPGVQDAIARGIGIVRSAGKAAGTLSADAKITRRYLELGALFVAVGVDTMLLVRAARELAAMFKAAAAAGSPKRPDGR
jgi:4-hydroxy-2-oxoheptanedioate aldolase